MGLSEDVRSMLTSIGDLTGDPTSVTIVKTGVTVFGLPGVATVNDTVLGSSVAINGDEKTLRFTSVDVDDLRSGDLLAWAMKTWKVKHLQLMGNGTLTKAFLQEVL
jgi:hypothetical protein